MGHLVLPVIFILAVGLPIAWLVSEFQERRWIRILAGSAALAMSFLIACGVGLAEHFNANAWYGFATKDLIDATVAELRAGNEQHVVSELKRLQNQFHPTWESRARYDQLVAETVKRIRLKKAP